MITRLKNQIEYLIGNTKSVGKKLEYRKRFKIIINSAMSDSELEITLLAFLNELERDK